MTRLQEQARIDAKRQFNCPIFDDWWKGYGGFYYRDYSDTFIQLVKYHREWIELTLMLEDRARQADYLTDFMNVEIVIMPFEVWLRGLSLMIDLPAALEGLTGTEIYGIIDL